MSVLVSRQNQTGYSIILSMRQILHIIFILICLSDLYSLDKNISVAIFDGAEPMLFQDEQGNVTGFYPSLLNNLLPDYSINYITGLSFKEAFERVQKGEIDIIPAFIKTKDREYDFYFNKEVVATTWGQLFLPTGTSIDNILVLKDKNIALMKNGQNGINFLKLMEGFNITFNPVYYDSYNEMMESTITGETFGMIAFNSFHTRGYKLEPTTIAFSPVQSFFATSINGSVEVIDEIDKRLSLQLNDENSQYYVNQKKWLINSEVIYPSWFKSAIRILLSLMLAVFSILIFLRIKLSTVTKKYVDFVDHSTDLVWIIDRKKRLTFLNSHAEKFFNLQKKQYYKKNVLTLFKKSDESKMTKIISESLNANLFESEIEINDTQILDLSITKVKRGSDHSGLFFFAKNVTYKKLIEHQLNQSQKNELIGTLTSSIAHDFNNLLSPILNIAQLLQIKRINDNEEKRKEYLNNIIKAATDSSNLVKQLLQFNKKTDLHKVKTTLSNVTDEFLPLLKQAIPKNISLKLALSGMRDGVIVDKNSIEQILLNLVINAKDSIENAGEIIVKTFRVETINKYIDKSYNPIEGYYAVAEISDTGCGMTQELQSRIFEPHYTTKGSKGSGLGLASCYRLIKQHSGYITVHSEVGVGTTFRIFLPIYKIDDEHCMVCHNPLDSFNKETLVCNSCMENFNNCNLLQKQKFMDQLTVPLILIDSNRKLVLHNSAFGNKFQTYNKSYIGEFLNCKNSNDSICGTANSCKSCELKIIVENTIDKNAHVRNLPVSLKIMNELKEKELFLRITTLIANNENGENLVYIAFADLFL